MTPTEIETQTSLKSGPDNQKEALPDVPAAHQAAVQRAIEIALAAVRRDFTLRFPRSDEDRDNGFANWLAQRRRQYEPMMRMAIVEAFGDVVPLNVITMQEDIECCVWPEIEGWLQDLAIRYHAGFWVRRCMGDATVMFKPERMGSLWRVPFGINGYERNMGQIILDNEGNVQEDLTTTPQEVSEKLRDRKFSPAETIEQWQ